MDALFITTSQVLHRFMSTESVMPSISSSVALFSSCYQSFLASGSFTMTWDFSSGGKNIGASASVSVLPMNTQNLSQSPQKKGGGGRSEIKKEKILFFFVGAMRFSYLRRKMSRGET